ncbi:enhanced serine sensitivity protein SseB C-terminal domain-containing protein [Clostridium aminobutyricum]|uniref:Enhanced serine sensitivity protein SseB C-terminal domain-containing protein n=1 Tax=Clostridium aminobutyricum TaxID=33953 RepID=A0A939DAV2_CLOAM|nr:enhanced serine sensitivity protein SseB C-terminal domain-containing protein [Clostridium aminobutyricum]MBN7774217.1 enhanced serine sensitivity protein SseB C-terminal domain-containing protein [Clostridium aminobutyricum]
MEENQTELTDLFKKLTQEKSSECESEFFKKLNETILWVPDVTEKPDNSKKTFALLIAGDGRKFIPTFLHKKSKLGRFKEEQLVEIPYNKLKYLIIDSMAEINGIVIAPFEENIVLDRKLMEIIDSQTIGMTLRRENHVGRIKLRKPDAVPNGLKDILENFFKNCLEVEFAWLMKAKGENELDEHWMLLIDFQGEKTELFPPVAEIMKPYMKPGEKFELIQKNPDFITTEMDSAKIYTRINNGVS